MGKGPCLPNIDAILQVGFDPKTGLPLKFGSTNKCNLKEELKIKLRIKDEQTAVNRYKWFNLPNGITGQMPPSTSCKTVADFSFSRRTKFTLDKSWAKMPKKATSSST